MSKPFNLWFAMFAVLIDLVAIVLGMVVAYNLRADGASLYYWPMSSYLLFVSGMLPIWLILLASQGLYDLRNVPRGFGAVGRILVGLLSGWGAMLIVLYLWRSPQAVAFPRLVIAYGLFFTLSFVIAGRIGLAGFLEYLYAKHIGSIRTAVLAKSSQSSFVKELKGSARHGRDIVAVVHARHLETLKSLNRGRGIDEIIISDPTIEEAQLLQIMSWAEGQGIHVTIVPSLLTVRT